jgi:hypothetical protein
MKASQLVSLGLLVLLGILVIGLMAKTPFIRSLLGREGFTSPSIITSQCPQGYKMYMYDGTAFCCNGSVNTDAYNLEKTCLRPVTQDGVGFCTLGATTTTPSGTVVQNCGNLVGTILQSQGSAICPPSKPNFCTANRCCQSAITADGTDCATKATGTYCDVKPASELFRSATDCNYLRIKEQDTCPAGTSKGDVVMTHGALLGMTIYSCSNHTNICYTDKLITTLRGLGKDTSTLTSCSAPNALNPASCRSGAS